jgi:transposase
VKTVSVPWAEGSSRFTILFERFAIDLLQETQNVKGSMKILSLKWDATWGILERAVERGKLRKEASPLPRIGIDEKAFKKGHSYLSLIYDLDNSTVEAISEGNDTRGTQGTHHFIDKSNQPNRSSALMRFAAAIRGG